MRPFRPAFSGLLPHPPIVVPPVGRGRLGACQRTTEACRDFAARLVQRRPERLFLVSPHSPRQRSAFGLWDGGRLRGDLGDFGAPEAEVDLRNDRGLVRALEEEAEQRALDVWRIPSAPLDHGAVVPLWFLVEAGWHGPTCIASLPFPGHADLAAFGQAVAAAAARLSGTTALVASGDMTHRATRGAPAGYHPRALEFDTELTDLVASGRLGAIPHIDLELREAAAEDAADSSLVIAAATDFQGHGHEVLSYEHPFGVGYLVAVFHDGREAVDEPAELELLPALAREVVRATLEGRAADLPAAHGALARRAPVFVTLRSCSDGSLRGCMGSLRATRADLVQETAQRAKVAALEDPRFPPVRLEELDDLTFEVSVLGDFEPVSGVEELDPTRYGVLITDHEGRTGVLLPDIAGVESAAHQLAIARRKAGIDPGQPYTLRRFTALKLCEGQESG